MNGSLRRVACAVLTGFALLIPAQAQDKPCMQGTVWSVSMIRVKPGMFDVYMNELLPIRKKMIEEAKKQGLVVSSRILAGSATGRDDFDLMILEEYMN